MSKYTNEHYKGVNVKMVFSHNLQHFCISMILPLFFSIYPYYYITNLTRKEGYEREEKKPAKNRMLTTSSTSAHQSHVEWFMVNVYRYAEISIVMCYVCLTRVLWLLCMCYVCLTRVLWLLCMCYGFCMC
jgi:sensor histidine kinase YesM